MKMVIPMVKIYCTTSRKIIAPPLFTGNISVFKYSKTGKTKNIIKG